jgi:PKD repeat protein
LLATRNNGSPNFSFSTGGTKLVRLIATNPTAQGACVEVFADVVNITPALVADILVTDFSDSPITPIFCQEANAPFTNFQVRFRDISTGTVTPNTRWVWEFFDETGSSILRDPAAGFSAAQLGPYDRLFTNPGTYLARLTIRDNVTLCETVDEVQIIILSKPAPDFDFDRVCAGTATSFTETSTLNSVNGSQMISWEWDMNYDGVTFVPNATLNNQRNFTFTFPAAGSYDVALRVTNDQNACSEMIVQTVTVDPVPTSSFTASSLSGCSILSVTLTNTSVAGQPDVIDRYIWEVDEGSGFQIDSIQRPTDPGFTGVYTRDFENLGSVNKQFNVRLRAITQNN